MPNPIVLFKQMRMRNQILIVNFMIVSFTISLLLSAFVIQFNIVSTSLYDISHQVLDKQNANSMKNSLISLIDYMKYKQQDYFTKILNMEELYLFPNKTQDFWIEQPLITKTKAQASSDYFTYLSFRYAFYNPNIEIQNPQYYQELKNLLSLMNTQLYIFESFIANKMFFLESSEAQMYGSYPQSYFNPEYQPHKRPIYIDHMQYIKEHPNEQTSIASIYLTANDPQYLYAVCRSLIDSEGNLNGMMAIQILIFDKLITEVNYNILMVDQDGSIIASGVQQNIDSSRINYIYEDNVTGMDADDWFQIQQQTANNSAISNCQRASQSLCRYNSLYEKDVLIEAYQFPDNKYTLILQLLILFRMNNVTYQIEIEMQYEDMMKSLINTSMRYGLWWFGVVIFLTIVTLVILSLMFKPLQRIVRLSRNHSNQVGNNINTRIFKILNSKESNMFGIFKALEMRMSGLEDIINESKLKKSKQCKIIENFKYHQGNNGCSISEFIGKSIQQLEDNQEPFGIKRVREIFHQCPEKY